jgi:putative phosphoesterase
MLLQFPIQVYWQQLLWGKRRLFLTHGHRYSPKQLPVLNKNDIFIYGHTHIFQAEKIDDIYCLNPGSTTIPKGGNEASFGLLVDGKFTVHALSAPDRVLAQLDVT